MRESIGSTFLYNIIFLFIIIIIGLLTSTINYYKAYKVNKAILGYISKYSGYNYFSERDTKNYLKSIGYTANTESEVCRGEKKGASLLSHYDNSYHYCVYYYYNENGSEGDKKNTGTGENNYVYNAYGVTTYIYVDLPIVGKFKVPVFTKGERIYNFDDGQGQLSEV